MKDIITQLDPEIEYQLVPHFKELQHFGIIHVGHGLIKRGRTPTALYSHREWAVKYREEQYYKVDPLRLYAINTNFNVVPWDVLQIGNKKEEEVLEERKKICSARRGILIKFKYNNIIETFALGTDSIKVNMCNLLSNSHIRSKLHAISRIHKSVY